MEEVVLLGFEGVLKLQNLRFLIVNILCKRVYFFDHTAHKKTWLLAEGLGDQRFLGLAQGVKKPDRVWTQLRFFS